MINIKKRNSDEKYSIYICAYFILNALNAGLQQGFGVSGTILSIAKIAMQLILVFLIINFIHKMKYNDFFYFCVIELFLIFIVLYSKMIGSNIILTDNWIITLVSVCGPCFCCAFLIDNREILYNYLLKFSWILLFLNMLSIVNWQSLYDMHFSYSMLLVFLLHFTYYIDIKKKVLLIVCVLEFFMILFFGSRGALICICVFFLLKILFGDMKIQRKFLTVIGGGIIVIVFYYTYISVRYSLLIWLSNHGYYSRTLTILLSGEFASHDSGRNDVWEKTIDLIKQKPLKGWGIGGAISELSPFDVTFPHQLILDLILTFGIVLGGICCVLIIKFCIKGLLMKSFFDKRLAHIFFCTSIVKLMFSATLFTDVTFFIFLGVVVGSRRNDNCEMSYKHNKERNCYE